MNQPALRGDRLRQLRIQGQRLEPVVRVGKAGLTEAVVTTTDQALRDHELIKVRFDAGKDEKRTLAASLAERTTSHLVQQVGHVVVLFRPKPQAEADPVPSDSSEIPQGEQPEGTPKESSRNEVRSASRPSRVPAGAGRPPRNARSIPAPPAGKARDRSGRGPRRAYR